MIAAGQKPSLILDTGPAKVSPQNWGHLFRAVKADINAIFKGWSWLRNIKKTGIRHISGVTSLRAKGDQSIQSVEYQNGNQTFEVDTRLLLVHDGVIPGTHLAMAAGCQHLWNGLQNYWAPVLDKNGLSNQPGLSIVGDGAAIAGADAAVLCGRVTGKWVARQLGLIDQAGYQSKTQKDRHSLKQIAVIRQFLDHHYRPGQLFQQLADDTIVCRCEQVSAADIRHVAALGCTGPNQAKAFTRCGMGPCMGRQCGNSVSQIFAQYHGREVGEIGHYRIRPPVKPLTLGQLANLDLD